MSGEVKVAYCGHGQPVLVRKQTWAGDNDDVNDNDDNDEDEDDDDVSPMHPLEGETTSQLSFYHIQIIFDK